MAKKPDSKERSDQLGRLWWLVDAPLFSDEKLIDKFHDALVWPDLCDEENESFRKKSIESNFIADANVGGNAEVKIPLPNFLDWLGPKLDAEAKLSTAYARDKLLEEADTIVGKVVENSERKLIEIAATYMSDFPDRILFVDAPGGVFTNFRGDVRDDNVISELLETAPRPLVFIDAKKDSQILPTMIEMEDGGFRPAYKRFESELFGRGEIVFPSDENKEKAKEYWEKLKQKSNSSRFAMEVVEDCCDGGRIGWIDFRMMFSNEGSTLHLHASPGGRYHTGTFAYNFVHRGFKCGCRIIGTLKSGNSVNILGIYDK